MATWHLLTWGLGNYAGGAIDVTPPGPPTSVSAPIVTDVTASWTFVPPTDLDYDHVVFSAWPTLGGATVTATGTTGSAAMAGLTPNTEYDWNVRAYDASGNGSVVGFGSAGSFTTRPPATITHPLWISMFVNNDPVAARTWDKDVEHLHGGFTVGDDRAPMGQGVCASILFEDNFCNDWAVIDFVLRYTEPQQAPFGIGNREHQRP